MNKTTEALKLSEEALLGSGYYDTTQQRKALAAIREARAEQEKQEPVAWQFFEDGKWWIGSEYNHHRQLTEEAGYPIRELYAAPVQQAEQEPFDMDDHPPHRLCECRKCMEYFTPLPDCDAFAASGKPIAEQTNTQFMEGYRIGLAEMREKCAKVCDDKHDYMCSRAAAAIRAINFEGDTGFRPVSEMVAEQEKPLYRKVLREMLDAHEQAEQEPVAIVKVQKIEGGPAFHYIDCQHLPPDTKLYLSPVRTKDLTDDEIYTLYSEPCSDREMIDFARAVIAKFKEKNK